MIARLHPDAICGAMTLNVPIPGVNPWDQINISSALWHFDFPSAPGLAEKLPLLPAIAKALIGAGAR